MVVLYFALLCSLTWECSETRCTEISAPGSLGSNRSRHTERDKGSDLSKVRLSCQGSLSLNQSERTKTVIAANRSDEFPGKEHKQESEV